MSTTWCSVRTVSPAPANHLALHKQTAYYVPKHLCINHGDIAMQMTVKQPVLLMAPNVALSSTPNEQLQQASKQH
jgi:hypothetical protein